MELQNRGPAHEAKIKKQKQNEHLNLQQLYENYLKWQKYFFDGGWLVSHTARHQGAIKLFRLRSLHELREVKVWLKFLLFSVFGCVVPPENDLWTLSRQDVSRWKVTADEKPTMWPVFHSSSKYTCLQAAVNLSLVPLSCFLSLSRFPPAFLLSRWWKTQREVRSYSWF